ncbi:hypothetical protein [Tunicatimonas pelagia]|uniref:hypothetical protein n=1 Tax=Tunicatimonas pelagia TaxID=931531 RepID=UPI002665D965|nr:hypothetical protein [Tunicatimonas pelagia]WKN41043.1 hypothetical protein P0M28_18585 [Tunicatimonas pelagia]
MATYHQHPSKIKLIRRVADVGIKLSEGSDRLPTPEVGYRRTPAGCQRQKWAVGRFRPTNSRVGSILTSSDGLPMMLAVG